MKFATWCRQNNYHLYFTRTTEEVVHVTHNYNNGKNELGKKTWVHPWHCKLETTVLGSAVWILRRYPGRTSESHVDHGYGRTRIAAQRDLISKIQGRWLFRKNPEGKKVEQVLVPKGLT